MNVMVEGAVRGLNLHAAPLFMPSNGFPASPAGHGIRFNLLGLWPRLLPVNFASMPDFEDQHDKLFIFNCKYGAVAAYPDAV